jgi:rhamnulokinase
MNPTFAAVDLGASSGRVITGHLQSGCLRTREVARFANNPVAIPVGGRRTLHWDALRLWSEVCEGLRTAGRSGDVVSVGVDTWAVDYGLLDADGALLGNPVHYRDDRTQGTPESFFAAMPAARHYAVTGVQVQPFNTVFQLLATSSTPQQSAARRLLLMPDLLGHWLSGAQVAEVTNASTTGLVDPTTRRWSDDVLHEASTLAGRDLRSLLPPLVEPGTLLGPIRDGLVDELALPGADLVAVGTHDTASAVAAVPMADPSRAAYISSGTWSLVGLELDAPVLTEKSRAANVTNELGIDGTVRYLRNVAGLWLLQESMRAWRRRGADLGLTELLATAGDVAPLRTVIDVAHPSLVAPGDMPARIAEIARATRQPVPESAPEVARCILDSLALAYRRAVRTVADLAGRNLDIVHVVGGGSRNALLCQLTANATGLPVLAGPAEGTAIGNLLVQASTVGAIDAGLTHIREVVAASYDLTRWEPTENDRAWEQAENRLRDTAALT